MTTQTIVILDFGSQYTQLIARRVRENSVYSVVHPFDYPVEKIRELAPRAIILSGGPQSVYAEAAPYCSREVFELGIPILGICYGMQLTAYLLGGVVEPASEREYGRAEFEIIAESPLFESTPRRQQVWASHGDRILHGPPGFQLTAKSESAPVGAFEHAERRCFGIQFHPEVTHSEAGGQILRNFIFGIAGCSGSWSLGDFRRRKVEEIRRQVGDYYEQPVDAIKGLHKAFEINSDEVNWLPRAYAAVALYHAGETERAQAGLDKVLSSDPTSLPSLLYRAQIDVDRKRYDQAFKFADRAMRAERQSAVAFYLAGRALEGQKKGENARQMYLSALDRNPSLVPANVRIGVLSMEEDKEGAKQNLLNALTVDPENLDAKVALYKLGY